MISDGKVLLIGCVWLEYSVHSMSLFSYHKIIYG